MKRIGTTAIGDAQNASIIAEQNIDMMKSGGGNHNIIRALAAFGALVMAAHFGVKFEDALFVPDNDSFDDLVRYILDPY